MIASDLKPSDPQAFNRDRSISRTSLFKLGVIVGCLALLYARVAQGLVNDWMNLPDFSHGFLVPFVSLYFVYERRKQISALSPSREWSGLGLIFIGILLLILGNLAGEFFTMRFSILVVIGGIILFLLGKDFFKALLFPLIFLILMTPIPSILMDQITFPMQMFASKVAAKCLNSSGIPVLREGNVIQLANTSLEVAEACSGIRSLISLIALSLVFAYFSQKKMWKRIALVLTTFPIAIVANAARVTGTGILAYHYGSAVAEGFFHSFSGWILFVVAFVCLFVIGAILSRVNI
jgi:exosortase A